MVVFNQNLNKSMDTLQHFATPHTFETVHITRDGKRLRGEKEFKEFVHLFPDVTSEVNSKLRALKRMEHLPNKKSVIAIYEDGNVVVHLDVENNFTP